MIINNLGSATTKDSELLRQKTAKMTKMAKMTKISSRQNEGILSTKSYVEIEEKCPMTSIFVFVRLKTKENWSFGLQTFSREIALEKPENIILWSF